MGNVNNYVTVTISKNAAGVTRVGFGTLCVLSQTAAFAERIRSYSNDAAVAVDFANSRSPERRASAVHFGQGTSPKKLKIGRRANKSTLIYQFSVVTVRNLYTYQLAVTGDAFDRTVVSFTSDGTATDPEIIAGLVIALNAVVSKNYTATGAASPGSMTASVAGGWFSVEVINPDDLKVVMTHADPGVTADVTAIALADADFYMVYNFTNASAEGTALATWTEANKRIFMCDGCETDTINTAAAGGTDLFKTLNTAARARTYTFWHHRLDQMPGAGLAGRCLPLDPGTEAWHDKTIASVDPTGFMTDTHRANIVARKANGYEPVAGIGVTFQGTMTDGSFLDITRLLDAFAQDASLSIFTAKVNSNKIGYDNPGIRKIANEFRGSINRFAGPTQGFNADTIQVVVPRSEDIPAGGADRTARILNGISGFVQATGAIAVVNVAINVVA
jgi:hypothetical protein